MSCVATTSAVSPSRATSPIAPTEVVMQGRPDIIACIKACGTPSLAYEGSTNRSMARIQRSGRGSWPAKRTTSDKPAAATCASSASRCGPSPTTSSCKGCPRARSWPMASIR